MRKIQIKDVWLFVAQVLLLSLVLLSPGLISYVTSNDATVVWDSLKISAYWLAPPVIVYLINFYLCVPLLWFRQRFWLFGLVNAMLIMACNSHFIYNNINSLPDVYRAGYSSLLIISLLVNLMAIGIALSIRYVMRQSETKQKKVVPTQKRHMTKEEVEDAIRILAEENARLKAQLDSAQREINEVRRQVMMAEMQACGYLPVYQEDGSVEFVLASQLKEPVEM